MRARKAGKALEARGLTLAVAESCTGGQLGDRITEVPGSSSYFLGGVISYSNEAKTDMLGVDKAVLRSRGAVSEEVAVQMAKGVRELFRAGIGVGVTGIAGPTGGTPSKPVGSVFIAVTSSERTVCARNIFDGDRSAVKSKSVAKALEMLVDFLEDA